MTPVGHVPPYWAVLGVTRRGCDAEQNPLGASVKRGRGTWGVLRENRIKFYSKNIHVQYT